MFFKKKSNILFRNYNSFGYITDNRNFSYIQTIDEDNYVGDRIISESGSLFISLLTKTPQCIDTLVEKAKKQFENIDIEILKNDLVEFYIQLEQDGFILSGQTFYECNKKDTKFSYKLLGNKFKHKKVVPYENSPKKLTQDYLEEFFNGKPQLTNLHIEITSKCNERCIHCYIPHEYKISHMESKLFYNIIEQCKELNILHLTISGGEPMLHKNFCDFIRKCNYYNFSVNILTNLTLLNDEIINEMKANPLLGVQVSLYSMNSIIHDEITQQKGSYNKTKSAILKLIENDIPLQISCPIMKHNKNCYRDVIKWAQKHKIHVGDDYGIIARYNHSTINLSCRLSFNEIKLIINNKFANNSKYIDQVEMDANKRRNINSNDNICSVCQSSICISENGSVYPCAGWQDYIVGNIKESTLKEIWDNSEKVKYLRGIRRSNFPKCLNCSYKDYCTICMVKNANENIMGDPLIVSEYFCNIAKINKKAVNYWNKKNSIKN